VNHMQRYAGPNQEKPPASCNHLPDIALLCIGAVCFRRPCMLGREPCAHVKLCSGPDFNWSQLHLRPIPEYRVTERDGRKGPPAENKARCNMVNI
jgi:hypothetical protein